jgi:hypothetical protein
MTSYELASRSGLMAASGFFLILSAFIAMAIYVLLTRPSARTRALGIGTVGKAVAIPLAMLIWIVVFSAIYMSSLAGFHTIAVGDDEVRLEYAIPPMSVALRFGEVGDVLRHPAYKSQWRLELYTSSGARYQSAAGSYPQIKKAADEIARRQNLASRTLK